MSDFKRVILKDPVTGEYLAPIGGDAAALGGHTAEEFASGDHNHDSVYSLIGHNHDDAYAPKTHTHDNIPSAKVYEAIIGTSWTEDSETGVKTQTVLIPNSSIDEDSTAKVDHSSENVDGTSEGYATFVEEENQYLTYITNGFAETVAGGIKFTIFGDPNTVNIPIVVEVV